MPMRPSTIRPLSRVSLMAALTAVALPLWSQTPVPVEETDAVFPGEVVGEVVVPVPSEIFSVLDKLGEPNWRQEIREVKNPSTTDRTRLSLSFGTTVAEGFVAVQAQDKEKVEAIGREVIDLATSLGLVKSVRPHAQAILDAAKKDDWASIRKELDLTQKTVRDTMEKMKDAPLAQCVSLGGWLRGTSSVTSVVNKNFSADRAELLFQPLLVEHFLSQLKTMPAEFREHAQIQSISKGLASIKEIMDKSAEGFTKESVDVIDKTCGSLLGGIQSAS
jgi:hypothetical protein